MIVIGAGDHFEIWNSETGTHLEVIEKELAVNEFSDYPQECSLKESVDFLNVTPGGIYLDATLGGGGQ